jgi:predicted component of type VI protein secretion system
MVPGVRKKAEKAEEKLKAYENIEKENRDLIKENSMLEAQIENLHSKLSAKLSEQARLKSELEAKIKGLQKEIDNYKQKENKKIQELEIAKAAETARLKERIEQLEKLVREYRKKEEKNDFF